MAIIKKATNNKCRQCHGDTCSYTVCGNLNWCGHYGKEYGDSPPPQKKNHKKLKIKLSYDPTILLLGIYLKKK